MTELTFTAGERATLDLRDSRGDVVIQDGEGPTIRVASGDDRSPFVLRDQDTFRVRLDAGGSITLPATLPVEVVVPAVVRLRVTRTGGETIVKPAEPATAEGGAAPPPPPSPADLSEFARVMSEQGRRIFSEMTDRVRTGGSGVSDDIARRLDEAAGRIDEQVQHVAERVEREVERAFAAVERAAQRAEEHGRRAAGHGRRTAERAEEHGRRAAERAQR
ncbi:MAG: hypothetical protein ACRDJN_08790, partial [Chloroflexota bacterium]